MDRSGAMLGWRYMHPGQEPPPLIGYVQDRDLWRFELPNSREISAALGSYPMDFEVWKSLDVDDLAREGTAILRFRTQTVESIVGFARTDRMAPRPDAAARDRTRTASDAEDSRASGRHNHWRFSVLRARPEFRWSGNAPGRRRDPCADGSARPA